MRINQEIYIIDKECEFCVTFSNCNNSFVNCDIIKKYIIKKIIIDENDTTYFCMDNERNQYVFKENDNRVFTNLNSARNELVKRISKKLLQTRTI